MQADLAAQRAAYERQIAADRDPSAWAAFRAGLHSARSGAHQTFSRKGDLAGLQKQLRDLEADLAQTLSLKIAKERKRERIRESISTSAAASEQLRNMVADQRNRKGQHAAVISCALDAVEALETKDSEDGQWREDIDRALSWYQQFAGFQVVEEVEGVKFVFDKVDLQVPVKEFSMVLNFDKDSEELLKDLNLANDLPKFVRITRERIQAASMNGTLPVSTMVCPDASPLPISSPPMMSVDSSSRNDADQSRSQSKNKKKTLPAKRRVSALSAASPGSVRRSPPFPAKMDRRDKSHGRKPGGGHEKKDHRSAKPPRGRAERSISPNGKAAEIIPPPPPPRPSGRAVVYTRELSPPASVPTRKRSSTNRGTAAAPNEVINVDTEAPLAIPEDKLEDVLQHLPGKAEELALDWLAEGETSHTPSADPAAQPAPVPAPATGPPEEKKRAAASPVDEVDGIIVKRPRSLDHDSSGDAPFGASELRIRLEKNKKLQESAADILSVLRRPSSGETSGVPTLVLPDATQADQRTKRNIVSDLEDIQIALRAVPLEKDDLIGKIEYNLIAWVEVYQGSPPADLQALMGHLKALVARLEGDSPSPGKATSLISQARPLLQQLEAACTETSDGIARLKADRPRLEKRVAELEKARTKQQACVAKYDELASEARRREKEVAGIAATYNIHVQAHDEAVATSMKEADALAKSRDEMATFLGSNDEGETNGSPPDGGLPEVQMIMSYKLEK